jgi:hypothetical protein
MARRAWTDPVNQAMTSEVMGILTPQGDRIAAALSGRAWFEVRLFGLVATHKEGQQSRGPDLKAYASSTPHHSITNSAVALVDLRKDSRSTYSLSLRIPRPSGKNGSKMSRLAD